MTISTVLVTGASGKIGQSLVPALVAAGYRVRVTRFQTPIRFRGVSTISGSIADARFVRRAMKDVDAVCHLATCKEDRERFLDVSVRGTFNLLEEARRRPVQQFLLASGDAAVGIFYYPHDLPLNETAALAAYPGYYALSKVLEETMVDQYRVQYALPVTILRCSWVHAEDDTVAHMTLAEPGFGGPSWRELARTRRQRSFFDAGRNGVGCLVHPGGRPFVRHIVGLADVVQSFLRALGNPAAVGQTFHIAGPAPFSYDVLAAYVGERLQLPVVPFTSRLGHDFSIDIGKARSVLGYQPQMDVFRMVDEAMAFRRSGSRRTPLRYVG